MSQAMLGKRERGGEHPEQGRKRRRVDEAFDRSSTSPLNVAEVISSGDDDDDDEDDVVVVKAKESEAEESDGDFDIERLHRRGNQRQKKEIVTHGDEVDWEGEVISLSDDEDDDADDNGEDGDDNIGEDDSGDPKWGGKGTRVSENNSDFKLSEGDSEDGSDDSAESTEGEEGSEVDSGDEESMDMSEEDEYEYDQGSDPEADAMDFNVISEGGASCFAAWKKRREEKAERAEGPQSSTPAARPSTAATILPEGAAVVPPEGLAWLEAELRGVESALSDLPRETQRRQALVEEVTRVIHRLWPEATVQLFGSAAMGLSLPCSDIDLVANNVPHSNKAFFKLGNRLTNAGFLDVQVITRARVPIIKCLSSSRPHTCVDVTLNKASGTENIPYVQGFMTRYPSLPLLVRLLKLFLLRRGLNEPYSGGLGSFALVLLVVSFYQRYRSIRTLIPPLSRVDEEDVCNLSLGRLLLGFLYYYGRVFNFIATGICTLEEGFYFPKDLSLDPHLPRKPWLPLLLDPQDEDNNVARSAQHMDIIRVDFAEAHDLLMAALLSCTQKGVHEAVMEALFLLPGGFKHTNIRATLQDMVQPKQNHRTPQFDYSYRRQAEEANGRARQEGGRENWEKLKGMGDTVVKGDSKERDGKKKKKKDVPKQQISTPKSKKEKKERAKEKDKLKKKQDKLQKLKHKNRKWADLGEKVSKRGLRKEKRLAGEIKKSKRTS